ncbi:uncharacterized protein LOC123315611 [Coccinella septempunctata]|uniref:uncharacterized protein LOC123315611 n=1 Tax=Coccinella septempunctata TaxID=41139 RepID=UPI001D0651CD|nr:uncharacterized protein LOC123315611 [Coccinella septempunctata]
MDEDGKFCYTLNARWLTMMFIDFIFGISGVVMCSLKLNSPHDSYTRSFLRVALVLTFVMILFGVVISIALYKEHHRCALLFSMLSLATITGTTLYSEASTSANSNFLILFSLFSIFFIGWFILYSYLQILVLEKNTDDTATPV